MIVVVGAGSLEVSIGAVGRRSRCRCHRVPAGLEGRCAGLSVDSGGHRYRLHDDVHQRLPHYPRQHLRRPACGRVVDGLAQRSQLGSRAPGRHRAAGADADCVGVLPVAAAAGVGPGHGGGAGRARWSCAARPDPGRHRSGGFGDGVGRPGRLRGARVAAGRAAVGSLPGRHPDSVCVVRWAAGGGCRPGGTSGAGSHRNASRDHDRNHRRARTSCGC